MKIKDSFGIIVALFLLGFLVFVAIARINYESRYTVANSTIVPEELRGTTVENLPVGSGGFVPVSALATDANWHLFILKDAQVAATPETIVGGFGTSKPAQIYHAANGYVVTVDGLTRFVTKTYRDSYYTPVVQLITK